MKKSLSNQQGWFDAMTEFQRLRETDVSLDEKAGNEVANKLILALAALFETFIKKAKIKDSWSEMRWAATSIGLSIHISSKTQNHEYTLGIYANEIYLQSNILHPQNIKNVANEFWSCFSELTDLGNFYFQENAGLPAEVINQDFDLRSGRSSIYKLIRNFIFLEEHSPRSTFDLGWYEYKWSITEDFESLGLTGCKALKNIHRLNYMLYRSQYLKDNAQKRTVSVT